MDAEEQLLLAQLEPEQVHLEDRLRELKRPRCDRGNKCESDCMLDHGDDNDDAPVETRVKGKERQKKYFFSLPKFSIFFFSYRGTTR